MVPSDEDLSHRKNMHQSQTCFAVHGKAYYGGQDVLTQLV